MKVITSAAKFLAFGLVSMAVAAPAMISAEKDDLRSHVLGHGYHHPSRATLPHRPVLQGPHNLSKDGIMVKRAIYKLMDELYEKAREDHSDPHERNEAWVNSTMARLMKDYSAFHSVVVHAKVYINTANGLNLPVRVASESFFSWGKKYHVLLFESGSMRRIGNVGFHDCVYDSFPETYAEPDGIVFFPARKLPSNYNGTYTLDVQIASGS